MDKDELIKELVELLDYHIERCKPMRNCPDQWSSWRSRGHGHRAYKKARKLLDERST